MALALTPDQQQGKHQLVSFLANPAQPVMVIEGYSGTGKSTMLQDFLSDLDNIQKTIKLINPKHDKDYEVVVSATNNKAADALSSIIKRPVRTIYSVLGLVLRNDRATGRRKLIQRDPSYRLENALLFIDEASYADETLLDFLFVTTRNCKIVLVGDPAQLLNPSTDEAPVFKKGYPTVRLTEVVRQSSHNTIQDLSTMFRDAVYTGVFSQFTPNGSDVVYLERDAFDEAIVEEFTRPDWKQADSRVLAWTNDKVQKYNQGLLSLMQGTSEIHKGDYMVCNSYVKENSCTIKTDAMVRVSGIYDSTHSGFPGQYVSLAGYKESFFMPASAEIRKLAKDKALRTNNHALMNEINDSWIDLRATFASTLHKSQGSTYNRVFIDLDDVNKCPSAETIARLMYVGVSRARYQVYLTGLLT